MSANNFAEYNRIKEELLSLLEESKQYFQNVGDLKQAEALGGNAEAIRSGEFEVVVVGEFSAGKSTFLNAMMREKYLPSYTKETTATINYLRHSGESKKPGIVYYADGRVEELDSIEGNVIEKYVSTKSKDMDVSQNIRHLDLFLESPFLENHVTLIDSPGLNGMKQGLGDITMAQIKRSHAVIFMFSAEQPGKRTDFEFLKKIKDEVKTVFLILNKIDCIKKSENQTVEDTVQSLIDNYKSVFPEDETLPEVIPVAAYPALVARSKMNLDYPANHFDLSEEEKRNLESMSRMGAFEEKLLHFLTNGEKTIRQLQEPLSRLDSYLGNSMDTLDREMEILSNEQSGAELENRISEIQTVIQKLEEDIQNQKDTIRGAVKTAERNLLEYMDREAERIKSSAGSKIEDLDAMERLEALSDEVEFMNQFLGREVKKLAENLDERLKEEFFDQLQEQYAGMVDTLEEKLGEEQTTTFSFDRKIQVSAQTIHAGIESFSESKQNIEKQIAEIENRIKGVDVKQDELYAMADRAEELKVRAKRLQESQDELQRMYTPPEVKINLVTRKREVDREGLVGKFLDLFGKKTEDYQEEIKDDSERKAYIKNYRDQQQELRKEQDKLEAQLAGVYGVDQKLARADREREQFYRQLQELRDREDQMRIEFQRDLDRKYERELQRIKKRMYSQIEEYFEEARPALRKILKEKRNTYASLLQDLLAQSFNTQLDSQKKECEKLEKMRAQSNYEKEKQLEEKKGYQAMAGELRARAKALAGTVSQIEIDQIQYQKI